MKRCPTCNRTYEEAQSYCGHDGTMLVNHGHSSYNSQAPTLPTQQGAKKGKRVALLGCLGFLALIFAFAVLSRLLAYYDNRKALGGLSDQQISDQTISVNAEQLFNEYETNEVSADVYYKGKKLVVSGQIDSIGKDVLDNMYIALRREKNGLFGVQCFFNKEQMVSLMHLTPGQKVTVVGRCEGKFGNVILRECVLR